MKPINLILLLLLLCIATGCKKLKAGIETTVTGVVTDDATNTPLANIKLRINEYSKSSAFSKAVFNRSIDSVITQADGTYSIHFSTTGSGIEYKIAMAPNSRIYKDYNGELDIKVGRDTVINFHGTIMHTIKAMIHVNDYLNPSPVTAKNQATGTYINIYGHPLDTVVFFNALPNQSNAFNCQVRDRDTAYHYRWHYETVMFNGFADTMNVNFLLDPNTFTP